MNIVIRNAQPSDAPAILTLLDQLGYPDFDLQQVAEKINLYSKPDYALLVAVVNNQAVAFSAIHWFSLLHWHGAMGRITAFCVEASFRSKGVGQALLQATEARLFEEGCIKLEVTSNQRRASAHNFYLKAGYAEDSRRFVKYRK